MTLLLVFGYITRLAVLSFNNWGISISFYFFRNKNMGLLQIAWTMLSVLNQATLLWEMRMLIKITTDEFQNAGSMRGSYYSFPHWRTHSVRRQTSSSKWNSKFRFGATTLTNQSGSRLNRNGPFHLTSDQNFKISGIIKRKQCDCYRKIERSLRLPVSIWSLRSSG